MTTRSPRRRGYLLLEVTLAGVITGIAVTALIVQLGDARVKSISAARDMTAQGLVAQGIERARSKGFDNVVDIASTPITGLQGTYSRATTVVPGDETLFAAQTTAFKDVTVTVTHPQGSGTRTYKAAVRLYE